MKCRCGKKPEVKLSYVDKEYCNRCFLHYIEQRVRKDIRINKDINPKDTIFLLNNNSKEFQVAKHFLTSIFGENIFVKETDTEKVKGKLVIPINLEKSISEDLQSFLENTYKKNSSTLILDNVMEEEVVKICDILGINANQTEKEHFLIENMEKKYPGSKFSLHHSFQKLKQL